MAPFNGDLAIAIAELQIGSEDLRIDSIELMKSQRIGLRIDSKTGSSSRIGLINVCIRRRANRA